MIIDLPPGTGDAQLTLTQKVPLTGAVVVTTPQDVALIDARKGLAMFRKVNVPVLGIIENMSYFICRHCGEREEIFGHGGGQQDGRHARRPVPRRDPDRSEGRRRRRHRRADRRVRPDLVAAAAFRELARQVVSSIESGELEHHHDHDHEHAHIH